MNKPCKLCDKERFANTSWCLKHYKEREKQKATEKLARKKERKEQSKGYLKSLRKKLHAKAWTLQSEWIRKKDANLDGYVECYTCLEIKHYKETNAGHYKHDRLDFDDRNLKVQCIKCNHRNSGELDLYAERLISENGLEWFNKLVADSWSHPGYSVEDLKLIIEDLKIKISSLDK